MKFFAQTMRRNRILRNPESAPGTEASQILNKIIRTCSFNGKYLEIGVENGLTLEAVSLNDKYGVDPNLMVNRIIKPRGTKLFLQESDRFFDANMRLEFDIVYLDGLHTFEQTYRDLQNVIKYLHSKSILMIDDTVPSDEFSSHPVQNESYLLRKKSGKDDNGSWHGDVYKLVRALAHIRLPNLEYVTLIDLMNPKTIIFVKNGYEWPKDLPKFNQHIIDGFDYENSFKPNINVVFNPKTTTDALSLIADNRMVR